MSDTKLTLVDHVYLTYRSLRVALALTCFALPLGLIIIGLISGIDIQTALSYYYFAEFPPMSLRVLFVGLLFLLGGFLIAYRGFSQWDNWIHHLAGVFAWGVAIFPMSCPHTELPYSELCYELISGDMHNFSALFLFTMSVASIVYNGGPEFKQRYMKHIDDKIRSFIIMRVISGIMVGIGIISLILMSVIGRVEPLWIPESMGFIGFGLYWWSVTYYIFIANRRAEAKMKLAKTRLSAISEEELGDRPTRSIP